MPHESEKEQGINYKGIAYSLLTLLMGAIVFIYMNQVAAQRELDQKQTADISSLTKITTDLVTSNSRLQGSLETYLTRQGITPK
jgi:hypothetical protein